MVDPFGRPDHVPMNPQRPVPTWSSQPDRSMPRSGRVGGAFDRRAAYRAFLANYSLHYVGGTGGGDVSADYYGAFAAPPCAIAGLRLGRPAFRGHHVQRSQRKLDNINFREKPETRAPSSQNSQSGRAAGRGSSRPAPRSYSAWVPLAMREKQGCGLHAVRLPETKSRARFVLSQAKGPVLTVERCMLARRCCSTSIRRLSKQW